MSDCRVTCPSVFDPPPATRPPRRLRGRRGRGYLIGRQSPHWCRTWGASPGLVRRRRGPCDDSSSPPIRPVKWCAAPFDGPDRPVRPVKWCAAPVAPGIMVPSSERELSICDAAARDAKEAQQGLLGFDDSRGSCERRLRPQGVRRVPCEGI